MIEVGNKVFLRGARFGLAGTAIRFERGKFTVYWSDLDHMSRHRPESLELAEPKPELTTTNKEDAAR